MGEQFAKQTRNCNIIGILVDEDVENLEDHGCPKPQDLVGEELWICSSYPFKHKITLHYAEHQAELFGKWMMQRPKL